MLVDSLQDILGQKSFTPPDEMSALKDYVKRNYGRSCRVKIDKQVIVLSVPSSALAATLQMEKPKIIQTCGLKSQLVIRIGR